MKAHFNITSESFKSITELPDAWQTEDYKALLDVMEYGDTSDLSDAEMKEMCLLSLADNEVEDAITIVLKYLFKDDLNDGQIQNLSQEMQNEKTWEEYADLSMHERFFNASQLLYKAYNGKLMHPEAVKFTVTFETKHREAFELFEESPEATIVRLLAQGMEQNALINRLYKDELDGGDFSEAQHIIWQLAENGSTDNYRTFTIISSHCWFDDFKYVETYEADLIED